MQKTTNGLNTNAVKTLTARMMRDALKTNALQLSRNASTNAAQIPTARRGKSARTMNAFPKTRTTQEAEAWTASFPSQGRKAG